MKPVIIIVAGGKGLRMGKDIPKQFLNLKAKPILMHTIMAFKNAISNIDVVLVLPAYQIDFWKQLCKQHNFDVNHKIVEGGKERFHSVKNGLAIIKEDCIVGIHDGVRPLVSKSTILEAYKTAEEKGNAIPILPIIDSIRSVENGENKMEDRSKYFRIQTPQVFKSELIKKAFEQDYNSSFTDDASVLEGLNEKIHLVNGNEENIKITKPFDLKLAELLLE